MRDLFKNFRKDEDGASLVEYAVALIVVTIVGGAGVLTIGANSGDLASGACSIMQAAEAGATTGTATDPVACVN